MSGMVQRDRAAGCYVFLRDADALGSPLNGSSAQQQSG